MNRPLPDGLVPNHWALQPLSTSSMAPAPSSWHGGGVSCPLHPHPLHSESPSRLTASKPPNQPGCCLPTELHGHPAAQHVLSEHPGSNQNSPPPGPACPAVSSLSKQHHIPGTQQSCPCTWPLSDPWAPSCLDSVSPAAHSASSGPWLSSKGTSWWCLP